jgi:hypothetical protein
MTLVGKNSSRGKAVDELPAQRLLVDTLIGISDARLTGGLFLAYRQAPCQVFF